MLNEFEIIKESSSDSINVAEFLGDIPSVNSVNSIQLRLHSGSYSILSHLDIAFQDAININPIAPRIRVAVERWKSPFMLGIFGLGAFTLSGAGYIWHKLHNANNQVDSPSAQSVLEGDAIIEDKNNTALVVQTLCHASLKKNDIIHELMIYNAFVPQSEYSVMVVSQCPSTSLFTSLRYIHSFNINNIVEPSLNFMANFILPLPKPLLMTYKHDAQIAIVFDSLANTTLPVEMVQDVILQSSEKLVQVPEIILDIEKEIVDVSFIAETKEIVMQEFINVVSAIPLPQNIPYTSAPIIIPPLIPVLEPEIINASDAVELIALSFNSMATLLIMHSFGSFGT
jgi:hypothetical protein